MKSREGEHRGDMGTTEQAFYLTSDEGGSFVSTTATAGPWNPAAQHGGPPGGLLAHALESMLEPGQILARISMDLLGPVPVGPLRIATRELRPGRVVRLIEADLIDVSAGRNCAVARAWVMPETNTGPGTAAPLPHKPGDGVSTALPPSWSHGYIDHVEWRWIRGAVLEAGPATVWMRPTVHLLPDVELRGIPLLMACVDSASGVSAALDPAEWGFMNTELTVSVVRQPVGEWVCVDAETILAPSSVGIATSRVYDKLGLVATSSQTLLVMRH